MATPKAVREARDHLTRAAQAINQQVMLAAKNGVEVKLTVVAGALVVDVYSE